MRALVVLIALTASAAAAPRLDLRIAGDRVQATVTGVARQESAFLRDIASGRRVPALEVRDQRLAVAIVFNGQEHLMTEQGGFENEPLPNLFAPLSRAVENVRTRADVVLVDYSTGARVVPSLGAQADYQGKVGSDLVAGVELAVSELGKRNAPEKLVIVVGDGNDTNNDAARGRLREMSASVPAIAVVVKSAVSPDGNVIGELTNDVRVASPATVETELANAAQAFTATFELALLPHDGKPHELALDIADRELARGTLVLPAEQSSSSLKWLVIVGPLLGLLMIGLAVYIGRRVKVRSVPGR